jgi:hypothetical protein
MMLPYDEAYQHGYGLGSQGQAEGRQQAFLRGSIAVVVELAWLVILERQIIMMYIRLNCLSFSISTGLAKSFRSFKRLPGLFPRSIIAASLVALRIKSGRLVKLPLASAS